MPIPGLSSQTTGNFSCPPGTQCYQAVGSLSHISVQINSPSWAHPSIHPHNLLGVWWNCLGLFRPVHLPTKHHQVTISTKQNKRIPSWVLPKFLDNRILRSNEMLVVLSHLILGVVYYVTIDSKRISSWGWNHVFYFIYSFTSTNNPGVPTTY